MAESKKVTVRLAPELVERLQRIADKRWMTPSQVLRDYTSMIAWEMRIRMSGKTRMLLP